LDLKKLKESGLGKNNWQKMRREAGLENKLKCLAENKGVVKNLAGWAQKMKNAGKIG